MPMNRDETRASRGDTRADGCRPLSALERVKRSGDRSPLGLLDRPVAIVPRRALPVEARTVA